VLGATAAEAASVTPRQAAQRGGFAPEVEAENVTLERRRQEVAQQAAALNEGSIAGIEPEEVAQNVANPRAAQEALSAVAGIGRGALDLEAGPRGEAIAANEAAQGITTGGRQGLRQQNLGNVGTGGFIEVGGVRTPLAAGQPQPDQRRLAAAPEDTLDRAATQTERRLADIFGAGARGGGLASAFALPNLAGNILRREAGGRISAREEREAQRERAAGLQEAGLRAGPASVRNRLAQQKFRAEETRALQDELGTALEAGDGDRDSDQFIQARSNLFAQAARSGPGTPSFNVASNEFGKEVFEKADSTRLNEFVDEFFNGERTGLISSIVDATSAAFASGDPEVELQPESNLFLNTNTGQLQQRRDDGSSRILLDFNELSDEGKQFFRSFGTFGQQGPGAAGRAGPLQGAQAGGLRRNPITGQ